MSMTERPMIQIDDLVREMTDEEYEQYLETQSEAPTSLPDPNA